MTPLDIEPGEVNFAQVRHDAWCPKMHAVPGECSCRPEVAIVDLAAFVAGVGRMNRAQRRAAEREARRGGPRGARGA